MGVFASRVFVAVVMLAMAACSGAGSGSRPGTAADANVGATQTQAIDITGAVYEGDIVTAAGQMQHMVIHLRFSDGEVTGYAPSYSVQSGHWEPVNDAGDMTGAFSIYNTATSESLELVFTGNVSGISGTTSSNGRFSLTATGAVMN